jgi:hypothetical protein
MTEVDLKVFHHVRAKLKAGDVVTMNNRGHGPTMVAIALRLDKPRVEAALADLVAMGWLERAAKPRIGYVLGPNAPSVDELGNHRTMPRTSYTATQARLPSELAERIGMQTAEKKPVPLMMLDWALQWANRGIHIFPCRRFLGIPLVSKWYAEATDDAEQIVEWWSEWSEADLAGVPDKSGHFVIAASGNDGAESLAEIEAEYGALPTAFRYFNRMGDSEHLWLKGSAVTSHHRLGRGLHVLGRGHYVYLPESWAPDHLWRTEANPAAWPGSADKSNLSSNSFVGC